MALPRQQQRRTTRNPHLDASIVHVELALLARAEVLSIEAHAEEVATLAGAVKLLVSQEFTAMAEELHFW